MIWVRFLRRAQRRFGKEVTSKLNWKEHGLPCIQGLLREERHQHQHQLNNFDFKDLVLTWKLGVLNLDLNKLLLMRIKDVVKRPRRLHCKNVKKAY